MKRKLTITISGEDGKKPVNVKIEFDPPLDTGDEEPPLSGWASATDRLLAAVQSLGKK